MLINEDKLSKAKYPKHNRTLSERRKSSENCRTIKGVEETCKELHHARLARKVLEFFISLYEKCCTWIHRTYVHHIKFTLKIYVQGRYENGKQDEEVEEVERV